MPSNGYHATNQNFGGFPQNKMKTTQQGRQQMGQMYSQMGAQQPSQQYPGNQVAMVTNQQCGSVVTQQESADVINTFEQFVNSNWWRNNKHFQLKFTFFFLEKILTVELNKKINK